MSKFAFYRFASPVRSRRQRRLREQRLNVDAEAFGNGFERAEIARFLWDVLRGNAFVDDFRPDPDDDLSEVYAMGLEEVWDDMVEPLLDHIGLSVEGVDFTGFDVSLLKTPRRVGGFVARIAALRNGEERKPW